MKQLYLISQLFMAAKFTINMQVKLAAIAITDIRGIFYCNNYNTLNYPINTLFASKLIIINIYEILLCLLLKKKAKSIMQMQIDLKINEVISFSVK